MDAASSAHGADSLVELIRERVAANGDAPYLLDARSSRAVSYASLPGHLAARGHLFHRWGLDRGERLGLAVSDPLTFSVWFLAAIAAGLWVAPLDPSANQHAATVLERGRALRLSAVVSEHEAPASPASFRWHRVDDDDVDTDDARGPARWVRVRRHRAVLVRDDGPAEGDGAVRIATACGREAGRNSPPVGRLRPRL